MTSEYFECIPINDVFPLSERLIYSSKGMVNQTYYHMFGNKIIEGVPEIQYMSLSVLEKRLNGIGVYDDTEKRSNKKYDIPYVKTISGKLTISVDEEHKDMFINKIETENNTFKSYGSKENYNSIIQNHVENNNEYTASSVWASFVPQNKENIHLYQIAICE